MGYILEMQNEFNGNKCDLKNKQFDLSTNNYVSSK